MTERELAVVTGAGSGLGREIARRLVRRGFRLLLVGRSPERLRETEPEGEVFPADLAREEDVAALAERIRRDCPRMLVNCAGIGRAGCSADLAEAESLIVQVNFLAAQRLSRAFCEGCASRGGGGILLNVCSATAWCPAPLFAAYAASKSALYSWTRALAEEERKAGRGISVTAGCPGPLRTGFDVRAGMAPRRGADPGTCAERLLAAAFRGKPRCVPGAGAKIYRLACRLSPEGILVRASRRYRERTMMRAER